MRFWWHSLLFLSNLISGLPWDGPSQSVNFPQPTSVGILLEPTPAAELVKRTNATGAIGLCGFIDQDGARPLDCDPHSTCFWNTDYSAVGCCLNAATTSSCQMYTSCYTSSRCDGCSSDAVALQCTDATAPACVTYMFATDGAYFSFACAKLSARYSVYQDYTSESVTVTFTNLPRILPSCTPGSGLGCGGGHGGGGGGTKSGVINGDSSSTSSPSTCIGDGCLNGTGSGGGKVGAAVAGAFGGFLTLLLIVGMIWYHVNWRRRRRLKGAAAKVVASAALATESVKDSDHKQPPSASFMKLTSKTEKSTADTGSMIGSERETSGGGSVSAGPKSPTGFTEMDGMRVDKTTKMDLDGQKYQLDLDGLREKKERP